MKKKLFVSHSSKTPENLALLHEVCTGFAGQGFEVLVDRGGQLYAGEDWDLRLNEWMAECHAAVILFSTAALRESDWVRKEAAILSWRREVQDDFTLIPVLLEGLQAEALQEGLYGVLRINKDQCIRDAVDAQKIVEEAVRGIGPSATTGRTPFERLEGVLASILEEQARAETLEDTWDALDGINKPQWHPDSGRRFASALVRFLLRDRRQALVHLETVLDRIRPRIDRDRADELLRYLACLWVDPAAAGHIAAAGHGGGALGLNGNYLPDFTAKRYGERAWPLSDRWRYVPVDATQRTPAAIIHVIRSALRPRGHRRATDDAVDRRINRLRDPVVVLIPAAGDGSQTPDEGLVSTLKRQFPKLVYLFGIGPGEPTYLPDGITLLRPLLDVAVEEEQFFFLDDVQDFISNRLYGSP